MHCRGCGYNLRALETGHCPECGRRFSTGAEIIRLVRRLRCRAGPRLCLVCGLSRTNGGAQCPACSSAFAVARPVAVPAP